MLTITKPTANRVDIELRAPLDAAAMERGLDDLLEAAEGVSGGRMLYRITDFALPSLGALAVELRRLPRLFSLLGQFERCAVLSDAAWLRRAAEIEGALLPGLSIRSFRFDEAAEAESWLTGPADPPTRLRAGPQAER